MRKAKKVGIVLAFIIPAILGFVGHLIAGDTWQDSAYLTVRMYLLDADERQNNVWVELARWWAPIMTVSGLLLILKTAIAKLKDFFVGFCADAVAIYGDMETKEIVKKNFRHAICAADGEILDASAHILMFSTDEKALAFYNENKDRLRGKVYIGLERNDSYSIALDNVKFFNPSEIIARRFWQTHDIRQVLETQKLRIAIVGSDELARKLLTCGLLLNLYSLTQKIEYHIYGEDDFFETVHSDFDTANADQIFFHTDKEARKDRLFSMACADRIILTRMDDNAFLAELAAMTRGEIYYFDPMGTFVNIFENQKIYPFGRYEAVLTPDSICTDRLYSFAKKLNHTYALKYLKNGQEPPTEQEAWDALDVFTKGSNIASADYCEIVQIIMQATGKTEVDDALAELEHIRWCRYHYMHHWKFGEGKKDKENRTHPCLVAFAGLDDSNRQKDVDGLRVLLSLTQDA